MSKEPDSKDICVDIIEDENASLARKNIRSTQHGTFLFPMPLMPEGHLVARFLAKVGLEALASRIFPMGDIDELIDMAQLDDLRLYARRGSLGEVWPYSCRTIYPFDQVFVDKSGVVFEMLNEYDILITESEEYYIIVIIFGVEFALNLGGRSIEGYYKWLLKHDAKSPLYVPKDSW